MTLADALELILIEIEGTDIPQEMAAHILQACQQKRKDQVAEIFPNLIRLWTTFAKAKKEDLAFLLDLEKGEKESLSEWLTRLSQTRDFRGNQQELARIVCEMLLDFSDKPLREELLGQIAVNNEACQDRAAMALNELYVAWKLRKLAKEPEPQGKDAKVEKQEESPKNEQGEALRLLQGLGKTLALRRALSSHRQMQGQVEGVEIYLYYETKLRDRLGLVTAIRNTAYGDMLGKRADINEEELVEQVEKHYVDELLDLPAFDRLFQQDREAQEQLNKILEPFFEDLDALFERKQKMTDAAYEASCEKTQLDQTEAARNFKRDWFLCKLAGLE